MVLSTNSSLYSTQRLVEAGERRGHEMRVINHQRCYMNIASNNPAIHYKGQVLQRPDAIIPRIGASVSFYGTAVVRQFEMMGVYCVNESVADQPLARQAAGEPAPARKGIGLPRTGFANSPTTRKTCWRRSAARRS